MSEKGSSQGYIFFNKKRKTWQAQFIYYDVESGKKHLKSKTFRTQDEARKYLDTFNYPKDNSLFIKNNGIPLVDFMRANLKLKLDTNQIGETQYWRVSKTIDALEKNAFATKKIDEIKSDEIQEYLNSLKHLSNSMIEKANQKLNQTFKIAHNKGYLMNNPMIGVIRPKSDKENRVVRALELEEQQALTDFLKSKSITELRYKNVPLFQMYLGLRVGEALALSIHDIDLQHKQLNIHRTLTTDENGAVIMGKSTKTYAGKRVLPIPDFLIPFFIEQMRFCMSQENNPEQLLFKPDHNQYVRRANINKELQRICKKLGIENISTHSLRHTYGTRCIESGMSPVVVQRLMGHKDIKVTLNTYTSVLNKFKESELDKVNQYYLNQKLINNNEFFLQDENESNRVISDDSREK